MKVRLVQGLFLTIAGIVSMCLCMQTSNTAATIVATCSIILGVMLLKFWKDNAIWS